MRNKGLCRFLSDDPELAAVPVDRKKKQGYELVTSYCFWVNSMIAVMGQWSDTPFFSALL